MTTMTVYVAVCNIDPPVSRRVPASTSTPVTGEVLGTGAGRHTFIGSMLDLVVHLRTGGTP